MGVVSLTDINSIIIYGIYNISIVHNKKSLAVTGPIMAARVPQKEEP